MAVTSYLSNRRTSNVRKMFVMCLVFLYSLTFFHAQAQYEDDAPSTQSEYLDRTLPESLGSTENSERAISALIGDVVIDPDRLFVGIAGHLNELRADDEKFYRLDLSLTLKYLGDDYSFPVSGIALFKISVHSERPRKKIRDYWVARQIRSPIPEDDEYFRPRQRGRSAIARFEQLLVENPEMTVREIIDAIPFEYLETNSKHCPQISSALNSLTDVSFHYDDPETFFLHADSIELSVSGSGYRNSSYIGWVDNVETSPGSWAMAFIETIEPCWREVTMDQFDKFEIVE